MKKEKILKPLMESLYKDELKALKQNDTAHKPENWLLSPQAVRTFILGSNTPIALGKKEISITKKYYGNDPLVERAIVTLAGNRGLMLVGEPGTAKTMLSELLTAAICGNSNNTIQGTAGVTDDMIKYSWNYALLLAEGPSPKALVPSPLYTAMNTGTIARFEEITRCPAETQDTLISVMSDKVLNIPELGEEGVLLAQSGFNVIATANTRDRGVNEMSSALKRRFNFETVFPLNNIAMETEIIEKETAKLLAGNGIDRVVEPEIAETLATVFHELREGKTADGKRVEQPEAVMSTAEAVSVAFQSAMSCHYFQGSSIDMDTMVQNIVGTVLKESRDDLEKIRSYFNTIVKKRSSDENSPWFPFYKAKKWIR